MIVSDFVFFPQIADYFSIEKERFFATDGAWTTTGEQKTICIVDRLGSPIVLRIGLPCLLFKAKLQGGSCL